MASRVPMRQSTPLPTIPASMIVEDSEMTIINQKLKALGIEKTVQLPQICVVGDQSTGKSSLIEALSMIKVPRADGCSTHCPLEVNLIRAESSSESWNCKISLLQKYDFKLSDSSRATKERPLGNNWIPLERVESTEFAKTQKKGEVCDLIVRAQAAILNPSQHPTTFLSMKPVNRPEVKFSPNAVRLDITQHELPSLSFVDLPGLVTHQSEHYLVSLVDKLVSQYARSERSINLLTISMTSDYDTSKALGLIKQLKADKRTLAVMTKPDLYPQEKNLQQYLRTLMGNEGPRLEHGFHFLMMPPDVNLDHLSAMKEEADFFSTDKRWVELDPKYRENLGTVSLSQRLSILLQKATRESLPSALQRIAERLEKVERRLQDLPKPPSLQQMSITLMSLITEFGARMFKLFESGGNADKFSLKPEWQRLAEDFRKNLLESRPRLKIRTSEEDTQMKAAERKNPLLIILHDEDSSSPTPPPKKKTCRPSAKTPVAQQTFHTFGLEEIRDINQRHATPGLTAQMFPEARLDMMKKSVAKFTEMLESFLATTFDLIHIHVNDHIASVFSGYESMPLYMAVMKHLEAQVNDFCRLQQEESLRMCRMEQKRPYTLDHETSIREARTEGENLLKTRAEFRLRLSKAQHDAEQVTRARKAEFRKKVEDLEEDKWSTEIELLAHVRAYHRIAASRFADNVCQSIHAHVFPRLATQLAESLSEFLAPMDPENQDQITEWLSEDPERERERSRLLDEQVSLLEARYCVEGAISTTIASDEIGDGADDDVDMYTDGI